MTDSEKQEILNAIKAESTDVTELEKVSSLDGLTGLPAMQGETLVLAPLSLLQKPATDAATTANAAAKTANEAASAANSAASTANEASSKATAAAETAEAAAETANNAAETITEFTDKVDAAYNGASARFDAIVDEATFTQTTVASTEGAVIVFSKAAQRFGCYIPTDGLEMPSKPTLYSDWAGADFYMSSDRQTILQDKVFLCGSSLYVWNEEKDELVEASGSGSGSGFYNVTNEQPLSSGYYTKDTAIAALANADIEDERKRGMILTFEKAAGVWVDYRFTGSDVSSFTTPASWEEYGDGKIKSITLNGEEVAPDGNGNVALTFDQISVDESLDPDSTNPVQNAAISAKLTDLEDAAVGGIDIVEEDGKNTLSILNKKGSVIASAEFTGGGGGGGTSTASRIKIAAALDKAQVKEGGTALLTYSYDHVDSENVSDGIKADLTIIVSRGTTTTYEQTIRNVSAGTYTLDISDYLLVGTTDVYVKAVATTADGTKQTKQAYTSISVITLTLTSSYNLANTIVGGGYSNSDTIEIPFTITGSGTKDVSMYLDGASTPTKTQTINKSGTVNGSFTIVASSLTAGRHTVQMVAERSGLLSDSIYIDILKAGSSAPFVGIKYTGATGKIQTTTHLTPTLTAAQYEQFSFSFVAYDPSTTPAKVEVYLNDVLKSTLAVPRSMQTYTNRFTAQGTQTLKLKVGATSYTMGVEVSESSIDISETTYGLIAKFDAAGRSNEESDPAVWTSGDIKTTFENFDWSSNGWTGEALKLSNGAKATIGYQPFASDIKSTGLTIELTLRVKNITSRDASVISCINNGKGLLITAQDASFKTGQTVTYTNEDDEEVTREIKLGTNYICDNDEWVKFALAVDTAANNRLMHLYVNGNRTGADIYDNAFSFAQDTPQDIVIDSSEADVEIKSIRIYNRALSDDEELENRIVDADTSDIMMDLYDDNNILGDTGGVDIDKILKKGKGVLRIVRTNKLDDVYAENNKKTDFKADIYFYSPLGEEYNFVLKDCNIRIQGTSSTKYPSKNIRIYMNKGGESLSLTIGGKENPYGSNKYAMRSNSVPMNLLCAKSDYSDSSMSLNTGGAKLFNDVFKELGLLTPPQRYQYEAANNSLSAVTIRTAIDGMPIDIFCAETEDGESEYYGQYNLNNEKSKSGDLFGMSGLDGFSPECPLTLETLNNGEKTCLFQSSSDEDLAANFDAGLETNVPDDVKWAGLSTTQQDALKRLFSWIRDCVPTGATSSDLSTFKSTKFVNEIDQYFDTNFILTYYLWTDYFLSVDQRAKNMLLRTWDGKVWYITYYDGDTQLGKRNDCFLVYLYTTDRDTYDAEASKYAFEGRESWLWNLVLANLQDDLKTCAANLRAVLTNERVLAMFNTEQSGNWSDRAFNKSGELKYIKPATTEMYGKIWPFIYALQGSNVSHRKYFIENRFALLDAKYGTSNFTSDNIDLYMSRADGDDADVVKITANEVYAFGYGTNNRPNIANSGIIKADEVATLNIDGAYTVNDPLRIYGASRIKVLNMTGAADHLKNGFDLGKCDVLRELNLQSSSSGSTGWWLVLSACKSLRKLNVRNQAQAKTGSTTSTELDLSNQTKLEYLDARGTQVQSVNFAQGAPLTVAYLPKTLTTLRLQYLSQLPATGLTLESYANVQNFIFSGCPLLDWQTLLTKCVNVQRIRVTGIDMSGDGSLLDSLMEIGGIDADGNVTSTCALVGSYQLTKFVDDDTYNAYVEHFPELNVAQPEYTTIMSDDSVGASANFSNLDNATGYEYDNTYKVSGHISKILAKRHRVLAKKTASGVCTVCQLHDSNSNFFADNADTSKATAAVLTGDMGDVMMYEPHYWYKGVNDHINKKKYYLFSSNEQKPTSADCVKLEKSEISVRSGYAVISSVDYTTTDTAVTTSSGNSVGVVDVQGYKQARWPSLGSARYGAVFADADGNVLSRCKATTDSGLLDGMYCFAAVPDGATKLLFTFSTAADFDFVLLTKSSEIETIEPDWVEHPECLTGVYEAFLTDDCIYSRSGVQSTANVNIADFKVYAGNRGKGFQLVDYEMSKDVANLFFASYGQRDSQGTCGYGTNTNGRQMGLTNAYGMTDTFANPTNTTEQSAYVWTDDSQTTKTNIQSPNVLGYENWYGNKAEWMLLDFCKSSVDYKWRSPMPDGTERVINALRSSGSLWPKAVIGGRYMDTLIAVTGGSSTTYYFDECYQNPSSGRVVYRSHYSAPAHGGVSCAYASSVSAGVSGYIGSRLAFRGEIVWAASVAAFKAATMVD